MVYCLNPDDGSINVKTTFDINKDYNWPRIGLQIALNKNLENIEWYGRGPMENYPDRKDCAFIGRYQKTVDGMTEKYVRAESMGERCDVRWVSFTNNKYGIRIESTHAPFHFSALHYTDRDLWDVVYGHDLPSIRKDEIYLSLDAAMRGLGNQSCGPAPLAKYEMERGKTYELEFSINPMKN